MIRYCTVNPNMPISEKPHFLCLTRKYFRKITYDDDDNLEGVILTSSSRRGLLAQERNDAAEMKGRRLDFADCADCEAARDAVCEGIFSVCDLELFGPPFSATAAASVETACTFARACSRFEANVACFGQCTPEGVYRTHQHSRVSSGWTVSCDFR